MRRQIGALKVPTVEHVAVPPGGRRVFVFADDDSYDVVSPLLISRITVNSQQISRSLSELAQQGSRANDPNPPANLWLVSKLLMQDQ